MLLLASSQADLAFHIPFGEMQVEGDEGIALLLHFADELFDLNRIEKEFAGAGTVWDDVS